MRKQSFGIRYVLLGVALLTAASSAAAGGTLAEAFGPEVYVYVHIPSIPALGSGGSQSAYAKIMADDEVIKFLGEGFPALTLLKEHFREATGRSFAENVELFSGAAALAVVPDAAEIAACVLVLEVDPDDEVFGKLYTELVTKADAQWEERQIPGATVYTRRYGRRRVSHALAGGHLVVSTSVEALKSVCSALLSGRSQTLADDARYNACLTLADARRPELTAYVNVEYIMSVMMLAAPENIRNALAAGGLTSLSAAMYASKPVQNGFLDTFVLYFPNGRQGVFASLENSPGGARKVFGRLDANTLAAEWRHVNAGKVADSLAAAYEAAVTPERYQSALAKVRELESELDISLRDDIVGSLGKDFLRYTTAPTQLFSLAFSGGLGQTVFEIELSDGERFGKAFEAFWNYLKEHSEEFTLDVDKPPLFTRPVRFEFVDNPFEDHRIHEVKIILNPMMQARFAVVVTDSLLIASFDAMALKNVLSATEEPAATLWDNPDYIRAATLAGTANAGASYVDTPKVFKTIYDLATTMIPFLLASADMPSPVDQVLLPNGEAIAAELFGSAQATKVTDNAIVENRFAGVGTLRTAWLAGVGGASLAQWRAAGSGSGEREAPAGGNMATVRLASVGKGLLEYAEGHGGAFPPNLETLVEEGLLPADSAGGLAAYRYVPGLTTADRPILVAAFSKASTYAGHLALLTNGQTMNLTEAELGEQVGGWLGLPEAPTTQDLIAACRKNLEVLAETIKRHARFHEGKVPEKLDRKAAYRFAPLVTNCPLDEETGESDYATVKGLVLEGIGDEEAPSVVLAYEKNAHAGKHGVAFLGKAPTRLTPEELEEALVTTAGFVKD